MTELGHYSSEGSLKSRKLVTRSMIAIRLRNAGMPTGYDRYTEEITKRDDGEYQVELYATKAEKGVERVVSVMPPTPVNKIQEVFKYDPEVVPREDN